jgi:replicative DNA helicase
MTGGMETTYDRAAETAVLAACLISPTARAEAKRHITGTDFQQPAHEAIWDAMTRLDRHKRLVDPVSVLALVQTNRAAAEAMVDVASSQTTASPDAVAQHAEIVRGWAIKRRLASAAQGVLAHALQPDVSPSGYAATVANQFASIRDSGVVDDVTSRTLAEVLADPDDEPDWLIPGLLERRDRLVLTGDEGLGKALAIDTPIPTPGGWTTLGDLTAGSLVFGPDGKPARVVAATDVMHDRPCYRVRFSDGSSIVADANHLWETRDYKARQPGAFAERVAPLKPRGTDQRHKRNGYDPVVRTTEQLAATLHARGGHTLNHSIDTTAPLEYPVRDDLLLDPYVLGAWLGDGSSTSGHITMHPDDVAILDRIAETWPIRPNRHPYVWSIGDGTGSGKRGVVTFAGCLRALGVFANKHIPANYLHAGIDQRLALLQGLMDTDGTVGTVRGASTAEFSVCSERLARDVHELLLGLGIKVKWAEGPAKLNGRIVGTRYRLAFQTELPVFHLKRKADRMMPCRTERYRRRYVTAVEPVEPVPVRCIQVDRTDGMFVAGRECIPTHNSHLLRQFAICAAAGIDPWDTSHRFDPIRTAIFDCENTENQVRRAARRVVGFAAHYGRTDVAERVFLRCSTRIDITRDKDLAQIHHELDALLPDLIVIGPLYKLVPHAIQTDDEAAPVLVALDTIRDRGIAMLIEAHSGHTIGGGGGRNMRPRGSSALLGWPEFGYGLRDLGADGRRYCGFVAWRGNRSERDFPRALRRADDGVRWVPYEGSTEVGHWEAS